MTLIPFESQHLIEAASGPEYRVGPYCARPGCTRTADHAHHVVRRSFIGGDISWVSYAGTLIRNKVGVCHVHHQQLTENESFLYWHGEHGNFFWYDQPDEEPAVQLGMIDERNEGQVRATHLHEPVGPAHTDKCPTCKRKLPKPKEEKTEERRPRRTWSITVPVDERENGAEILDGLLETCAELFGHDDESKQVRYFTLAQALALVVQNGHRLVSDE